MQIEQDYGEKNEKTISVTKKLSLTDPLNCSLILLEKCNLNKNKENKTSDPIYTFFSLRYKAFSYYSQCQRVLF